MPPDAPRRSDGGRGLVMLLAVALGHVVVDFYAGMLAPLQEPTLTAHLGRDLAAVSVLIGAFSIAVNLAQPALGLAMRDRAAPWLLVLAPALAAVMAGLGLVPGYGAVLALVLVSAAGVAAYHPEGAMAVHAVGGRRQHLGMSLFVSGGFFGGACGGLAAGWWAGARGLSGFWLLALPGLAMSLLLLGLGAHRLRAGPVEPAGTARQDIPFAQVLGLAIAFATGITLLFNFLPVALVHRFGPGSQKWGGACLFALGLSTALGSYAWAGLAARGSSLRVIAWELALSLVPAGLLLAALQGAGVGAIVAASALTGLATGGVFPLLVVLARGAAPAGRRLRMGLIIGGTWGSASALYILAGALTRWWPPGRILTAGLPLCLAAGAGLAALLARAASRRKTAAAG